MAACDLPPAWLAVSLACCWIQGDSVTLAGYVWFAVLVDGDVAAVGALGPTGWVGPSGVLPAYRGRGFQKLLIRARVAEAVRLGLPKIESGTVGWNEFSRRNLVACGFRLSQQFGNNGKVACERYIYEGGVCQT